MLNVGPFAGSPVTYSLVASDKGDISNRLKCAGAQFVNNAKGVAGLALVGAGTTAAAYGIDKSSKIAGAIAKGIEIILKKFPSNRVVNKLLSASPKMKAFGLVASVAGAVLAYIGAKTIFKAGQIDQKYTDRAIWEARIKAVFDA